MAMGKGSGKVRQGVGERVRGNRERGRERGGSWSLIMHASSGGKGEIFYSGE